MKIRELVVFLFVSISILFLVFFIHKYLFTDLIELETKLTKSYLVSSSLLFIGSVLFYLISFGMKDKLGFIFIFWIIAKFVITYKLLYFDFKSDGEVSKIELLAIILPYLLALISLTFYVSRLLNAPQSK